MNAADLPVEFQEWALERARACLVDATTRRRDQQTSTIQIAIEDALCKAFEHFTTRARHVVVLEVDTVGLAEKLSAALKATSGGAATLPTDEVQLIAHDPITQASFPKPAGNHRPPDHPDDIAVDQFAVAMRAKLATKRAQGRGGWDNRLECTQQMLSTMLIEHIPKGDPVDVANFAMMLHQRGETILSPVTWQRVDRVPPPTNTWVHTWREGDKSTNMMTLNPPRVRGDEPEWVDRYGRTTITHHSLHAPTHYARVEVPKLSENLA